MLNAAECPTSNVGQWLSFLDRNLYSYRLEDAIAGGFGLSAQSRSAMGHTVARFRTVGGASRLRRAREQIVTDGQDRLAFYLPIVGEVTLSQFGRTAIHKEGSIGCLSAADRAEHVKFGNNDTLCMLLPRKFVEERIVHPEAICARPFEDKPVGRLALDAMKSLSPNADDMDDEQFAQTVMLIGELVLLAFRTSPDLETGERSVRGANLARAKRVIRRHCGELDLSVADIADRCGLSVSYLHKLFRDDGRTVWEYLTQMRLYKARDMAMRPAGAATSVTDIALSCGYSNMSQFSTAFKRAFGVPPSEILRRKSVP